MCSKCLLNEVRKADRACEQAVYLEIEGDEGLAKADNWYTWIYWLDWIGDIITTSPEIVREKSKSRKTHPFFFFFFNQGKLKLLYHSLRSRRRNGKEIGRNGKREGVWGERVRFFFPFALFSHLPPLIWCLPRSLYYHRRLEGPFKVIMI